MEIIKPKIEDLDKIKKILFQWTENSEVEKYSNRIKNEIYGQNEFGMCFWAVKKDDIVVGIGGLSEILPKIRSFSKTENPGEVKILYLDNNFRSQGIGREFLIFLENKAREIGYTELLIRSANRYKETAYSFYRKMNYEKVGLIDDDMAVFRKKL